VLTTYLVSTIFKVLANNQKQSIHHLVMSAATYGVVGVNRYEEITRYHSSSLVNQLVESMLAVGSWFTPDYRPCGVLHLRPISGYKLHVALLEVRCKLVQVLQT